MIEQLVESGFEVVLSIEASVVLDSHNDEVEETVVFLLFGVVLFVMGALSVKKGADKYQTAQLVKDTAPEKIRSMAVGRTELQGKARGYEEVHPKPFTDGECVVAKWGVYEWQEKNPDDDDDDSKGWVREYRGRLGGSIVLEDDTGAVTVEEPPLHRAKSKKKTQGIIDNLFEGGRIMSHWFDFGPDEQVRTFLEREGIPVHADNRRQYRQQVIPEGVDMYVLGQATRRDEDDVAPVEELSTRHEYFVDELTVEEDESSGEFIVSMESEGEVARRNLLSAIPWILIGVIIMASAVGMITLSLRLLGFL